MHINCRYWFVACTVDKNLNLKHGCSYVSKRKWWCCTCKHSRSVTSDSAASASSEPLTLSLAPHEPVCTFIAHRACVCFCVPYISLRQMRCAHVCLNVFVCFYKAYRLPVLYASQYIPVNSFNTGICDLIFTVMWNLTFGMQCSLIQFETIWHKHFINHSKHKMLSKKFILT